MFFIRSLIPPQAAGNALAVQFNLTEITGVQAVRNRWYFGWGIRHTPHGWLFNISGLDAVEFTFRSGKHFRIGTDEPDKLVLAIRQATGRET